jgi:hypothetical protein
MSIKIIIFFLFFSTAFADEKWDSTDQALYGAFIGLNLADVVTTKVALNKGAKEKNPIYGKHPSTGVLIGGAVVVSAITYFVADNIQEKYRTPLLVGLNVISASVVANNISVIIKLSY